MSDSDTPLAMRPKVLVVDDRDGNLVAMEAILRDLPIQVMRANSGLAALGAVLHHDFAVILLDVAMPEMDGFTCATLIRQRPRCAHTPIIFITASIDEHDQVQRAYQIGAADYLPKPLTPAVVRAKVLVFVKLFHQREQLERQAVLLQKKAKVERQVLMERAEAALNASEAQYEATTRQAPFGIAVLQSDGAWAKVNQRLCTMLGYKPSTLPSFATLLDQDDNKSLHLEVLQNLFHGERDVYRGEVRLCNAREATVWANITLSRLSDGPNSPLSLVMEDITGRKHIEHCQIFLNQASEILLSSLDYQQTLKAVAEQAVPLCGDWCAIDLVDPEDRQAREHVLVHAQPSRVPEVRAWRRAALWDAQYDGPRVPWGGQEFYEHVGEHTLQQASQDSQDLPGRPCSLLLVPLTAHGRGLGTLTLATDSVGRMLTSVEASVAEDLAHRCAFAIENALLYEEARRAVRVRDDFLSVASHELRTPLTPLRIQLQRITGTPMRPPANLTVERLREVVGRADHQAQRLARLIDNLLDVSRITSGRLVLDFERVDLGELIREVVARHTDELAHCGSILHLDLAPIVTGQWDRSRLDQVITNLLTNAIKYGAGKKIEITVRVDEGIVCLQIRDHGIGIGKDKQSAIFERFERAVPARAYGGLGLGLFIARQILDAHGGSIEVTSDLGHGAQFDVRLPLQPALAHGDVSLNHRPGGAEPPPRMSF